MKRKLLYNIVCLFATFFIVSCEDLEDTYDQYAGGVIRYVGKCSDLDVQAGWKRLRVTWKGNLDTAIDSVKITWKSETDAVPHVRYVAARDILENADLRDTVWLEGLSNSVYTVTVSNVSLDAQGSVAEQAYARPYTEEHENLRSFTRGIVNFYVLKDRLAVILDEDNENMFEVLLNFWGTDGKEYSWDAKKRMNQMLYDSWNDRICRDYFFLLPEQSEIGIDFQKPITVKRKGIFSDCIDTIAFENVTLALNEQVWSSEFSQLMTKMYGYDWESKVSETDVIELDYNITSFQDLCYFPNLKKVILGKNRYMPEGSTMALSETDFYKGLVTLQFLKKTYGIEVERYNRHYFGTNVWGDSYIDLLTEAGKIDAGLIQEKGSTNKLPDIVPLDTTGWEVMCTDSIYDGYKTNGAAYLLVDEVEKTDKCFEPGLTTRAKVFEVVFDMKKPTLLKGFKVVQPGIATQTKKEYLLASVKIELSSNGYVWEDATYETGGTFIGGALGETTLIKIPEELQRTARYIRLTVANQQVTATSDGAALFSLRLGAFIPF